MAESLQYQFEKAVQEVEGRSKETIVICCDTEEEGQKFVALHLELQKQTSKSDGLEDFHVLGNSSICMFNDDNPPSNITEMIYHMWHNTGVFICNISRPLKNNFPKGSQANDYCQKANRFYYTNQVNAYKEGKQYKKIPLCKSKDTKCEKCILINHNKKAREAMVKGGAVYKKITKSLMPQGIYSSGFYFNIENSSKLHPPKYIDDLLVSLKSEGEMLETMLRNVRM